MTILFFYYKACSAVLPADGTARMHEQVRDVGGVAIVEGLSSAPTGLQLQPGWSVSMNFSEPPHVRAVGW